MRVYQLFLDLESLLFRYKGLLCYVLTEVIVPVKLVKLIKICLNEASSEVWLSIYLSDTFPVQNVLKEGDTLKSFLYGCASKFVVRRVQVNQEILK
jgi:hypothetical protein